MINLPFPPTTNSLTGVFNGRKIKTRRYREWETEAGWACKSNPGPDICRVCGADRENEENCEAGVGCKADWNIVYPVNGPYHLEITLVRPDKRPRDCNNYDKAISDLLVTHGITPDDHLMQSLTVRWSDAVEGPTVRVRAG